MAKPNVHTTYSKNEGTWRNISAGSKRPIKVYPTKEEAQSAGRQIARQRQVEHLIHNQNGIISQRNSYGSDKFPPRG